MSAVVEPTPDQLAAMAYVDGELSGPEREAFARRLAAEPELRLEVSELRGLAVLARASAPDEPTDHEWQRMLADPLHRALHGGGLWAVAIGVLCFLADLVLRGAGLEWRALAFVAGLAVPLGLIALLAAAIRWRSVEFPHDPYVKVQR